MLARFGGRIGEGQKGYGQMVATFFSPPSYLVCVMCVTVVGWDFGGDDCVLHFTCVHCTEKLVCLGG